MPRRVFDTNVLINHWHRFNGQKRTAEGLLAWANELIDLYGTNLILSPVRIEFLAGARDKEELQLYDVFLRPFKTLDEARIPVVDWEHAERFARWTKDRKPRQLGDCLIQAIARRFNADIISSDQAIKSRIAPS